MKIGNVMAEVSELFLGSVFSVQKYLLPSPQGLGSTINLPTFIGPSGEDTSD